MGENLCLSTSEDEGQLVREPFSVMQDSPAILFLFFPMIRELHRSLMSDVSALSFSEHSVQHSRGTEQSHVSAV